MALLELGKNWKEKKREENYSISITLIHYMTLQNVLSHPLKKDEKERFPIWNTSITELGPFFLRLN